jgi:glycosyltransferase involved in cell wall biosynthesis
VDSPVISIVIPAYNESKTIGEILSRTNKTMETLGVPYEIIVIDDGSTDQTKQLAEKQKANVISNGINRGKGYALIKGFKKARGNILVTMDADGSHQPEEIPKLIKPLLINNADVVAGSRFLGSKRKDSIKKLHIIGNHFFNFLILLLTRRRITDSQTGFRAFKKKIIHEIALTSKGYEIETELTIKLLKNGYLFQEEPITCEKRREGSSHLNPLFDGFKILRNIIKASIFIKTKRSLKQNKDNSMKSRLENHLTCSTHPYKHKRSVL